MNRNLLVVSILMIALWTGSVYGGQPVFSVGLSGGTLREMDLILLNVAATDSSGHQLAYDWSIVLDETNGQAFFSSIYHASAEFAVRWISSAAAGQLNGKRVTIKVVARHANPLDGSESAETMATYTIQGVNHPPVPVISGKLGTPTNRIPTGYGVCADGYASTDPDGDTVRGNWGWGARSGGQWITPLGDLWPTLFGSEGGRCCFTVIDMTAPIDQRIELTLLNGLHTVKAVATCYLKPADVTTNQAPVARIHYMVGSAGYVNAPPTPVDLDTSLPATVMLTGDASTDDAGASNLTYTWTEQDSVTGGSVTLSSAGAATTVQIDTHTTGAFTVTLTVKDQAGLTGTATISFNLADTGGKPIARAVAKVMGQALTGPVEAGTLVTLDGSESAWPDDSRIGLAYQWTQTEGPNVTITDADKAVAQITAPAGSSGPIWLKFQLIVRDGTIESDPVDVTVDLSSTSSYFSQIAVGHVGTSELRSCLLLVNGTSVAADGVEVSFFGQDGKPLDVIINGLPWDGQAFSIPPFSSERLVFTGQGLKLGWARVKADHKVTGLLLYQVVDADGDLQKQVGLYSTDPARRFASFYDPIAETAIAVANPSGQPAQVRIRIVDNKTGAEVVSKLLFENKAGGLLPAMGHEAKFLTRDFLGQLPPGFSVGTLLVESDVPVAVTILQTKGGVVLSTLPVQAPK
jgi:hypothetical protein